MVDAFFTMPVQCTTRIMYAARRESAFGEESGLQWLEKWIWEIFFGKSEKLET